MKALSHPCCSEVLAWTTLAGLLIAGLPLFLCMPLWADVTLYDLGARNLLQGGVHYRDLFDTNPPGMVWIHAAIRAALGWRSETLRGLDFLVVAGVVGLLQSWLRQMGSDRSLRIWTVVLLFGFYLSTSEWCHCQRDTWMLLPALVALHLRLWQVQRLTTGPNGPAVFGRALVEGLCWSSALWIKPFVFAPALLCWSVGAVTVRRSDSSACRLLALDAAGLLIGGILIAGAGILWLWWTGSGPYFWRILVDWNPEYHPWSLKTLFNLRYALRRFAPWGLVHLAAVPVAVIALIRRPALPAAGLLAAFYLGWLLQAFGLQKRFDYQLAPPVLVGLALLAAQSWLCSRSLLNKALLAVFLALAVQQHPVFRPERLALWGRCWQEGSTSELRNQLSLTADLGSTDWVALARVADFLRCQAIGDGELTCYNNFTHTLYLDLNLRPSTPFLHFDTLLTYFPSHGPEIGRRLAESRQRYIVTDLRSPRLGLNRCQAEAVLPDKPLSLPPAFPPSQREQFPWAEPIIFRAGRYLVHRVTLGSPELHGLRDESELARPKK
jgi:hypothetical protein